MSLNFRLCHDAEAIRSDLEELIVLTLILFDLVEYAGHLLELDAQHTLRVYFFFFNLRLLLLLRFFDLARNFLQSIAFYKLLMELGALR